MHPGRHPAYGSEATIIEFEAVVQWLPTWAALH